MRDQSGAIGDREERLQRVRVGESWTDVGWGAERVLRCAGRLTRRRKGDRDRSVSWEMFNDVIGGKCEVTRVGRSEAALGSSAGLSGAVAELCCGATSVSVMLGMLMCDCMLPLGQRVLVGRGGETKHHVCSRRNSDSGESIVRE